MNELPQGVEPLRLADGTLINPDGGAVIQPPLDVVVEVPNNAAIQREYIIKRRKIADLPVAPEKMTTISVILGYSLMGVQNEEIATLLGMKATQVGRVRMSDEFREIRNDIVHNIIESDNEGVRDMLSRGGVLAASRVLEGLNSANEAHQLASAKDILDRGGHRPADVVEHRHKVEGGLTIEHVKREDQAIPVIDIKHEVL